MRSGSTVGSLVLGILRAPGDVYLYKIKVRSAFSVLDGMAEPIPLFLTNVQVEAHLPVSQFAIGPSDERAGIGRAEKSQ
jgi:hypothetical protein